MDFLRPGTLAEALEARAERPDAVALAGGTDLMVELNFDRRRPPALLDLTRVGELDGWSAQDGQVRIGARLSWTRVIEELGDRLPGLAMASRTVGSPQIRNRGTLGGNLGSASPAGDAHPALLAAEAVVELRSVRGTRTVPVEDFFRGVKRHAGEPDELITAVLVPASSGPQQFAKIGTRNAMVISVASCSVALHPDREVVRAAVGSVAPTPRRAHAAEDLLAAELGPEHWRSREPLAHDLLEEFARLVAGAASPIDDVRGTAAYRLHALGVLARRSLTWVWAQHVGPGGPGSHHSNEQED